MDHLKFTVSLPDGPGDTGFADISLVHNCLPDLAWQDIELSTAVAGLSLKHPVIINAITGGATDVTRINAQLAELAMATNSAMAVGSQYSALEDPAVQDSYKIVRKINPNGIVFANVGAHVTVDQARRAVAMIEAQALQIHLNAAQEILMPEGDRDFSGYLDKIAEIACKCEVPVIVKEVGFGVAREQAKLLSETDCRAIDIGGMGGTNFMAIESARGKSRRSADNLSWGIPTAISAIEVRSVLAPDKDMVVSGGVRTALDALKSLILGGCAVGVAGPVVRLLHENSLDEAVSWLNGFLEDIKRYMLLLGISRISGLPDVPVIITGRCRDWLLAREIDPTKYANPKKHG
jgi:isopentenyl-diphosphate delta-isomerase